MPLLTGCTEDDIQANIATLIDEGKSPDQAAEIAHDMCDGKSSHLDDEDEYKATVFTQEEVNYTPNSPDENRRCGNCRWFQGEDHKYPCFIVLPEPEAIVKTGLSDAYEPLPERDEQAERSPKYYFGGSVKAVGGGIIEGYLVPFT
ncbi:hypothetical protein LCGC14_2384670, partial [marine sediment metagenome]